MKRIAIVCLLVIGVCLAAPPARADHFRGGGPPARSVFPAPRDPWRSWGVHRGPPLRHTLPRHVAAPRVYVAPEPVWMPEQWVWDGAAWVWWPGGWVR